MSRLLLSGLVSVAVAVGLLLVGSGVFAALQQGPHAFVGALALGSAVALGGTYVGTAARLRARNRG